MEDFQVIDHIELPADLVEKSEVAKFLYTTFLGKFRESLQVCFVEVRYPGFGNARWHQDDGKLDGEWMALWSNEYPTEVRLPDGSIMSGVPGDVILFNNFKCFHRTPTTLVEAFSSGIRPNRWAVRLGCFNPVEKVKVRVIKVAIEEESPKTDAAIS